ncbi:MAG: aminopeptidase P family protein [Planctomycetes bacterium]|nr:aminopeptidase P family protein [Planctomycetota bacterium]
MKEYLVQRRRRVAEKLSLGDDILVVGAGEHLSIPGGADQTYKFIPHSEYRYLADRAVPSAVVAYDANGGWVDFLPPVTEAERIWEGREPVEWTDARPLTELPAWIAARRGRRVVNLGSGVKEAELSRGDTGWKPVPQEEVPQGEGPQRTVPQGVAGEARVAEVREMLMQARRCKDDVEMARIRKAVSATVFGFKKARETIAVGATERRIQVEMEAEFYRRGADRTGYGTIVGSGPNSAILHFDPSAREVRAGELVLIDAGAEIEGYTADVTRTYAAEGPPQGFAGELYGVVLRAQIAAIKRCTAGAEFREIHMAAARDMAQGMVEIGVLKGNAAELVDRDAHAMFFPHGLGHLVGLGVRDASGYLPGRERSTRFGLAYLRIDMPLQANYVVTIEPGLYFIPAILQDPERRKTFADAVNWPLVDKNMQLGGVRIEDDVLVTNGPPEVLTKEVGK